MKSSRWLWNSISLLGLLTTFLFVFGFVYAVNDILNPKPSLTILHPEKTKPVETLLSKNKIQIVSLGDSLTVGTGDDTGKGYVGDVKDQLSLLRKKPVYIMQNFAVNGYATTQLLHDLETKKDERQTLAQANLILMTIGGNDLFHLGKDEFDPALIKKRIPAAEQNLSKIFKILAEANPKATIIYLGLYHPFLNLDHTHLGSLAVQEWNNQVFQLANLYPNITVVPTYDLFINEEQRFLYNDHFHPNQQGYSRIANRIVKVLQ